MKEHINSILFIQNVQQGSEKLSLLLQDNQEIILQKKRAFSEYATSAPENKNALSSISTRAFFYFCNVHYFIFFQQI